MENRIPWRFHLSATVRFFLCIFTVKCLGLPVSVLQRLQIDRHPDNLVVNAASKYGPLVSISKSCYSINFQTSIHLLSKAVTGLLWAQEQTCSKLMAIRWLIVTDIWKHNRKLRDHTKRFRKVIVQCHVTVTPCNLTVHFLSMLYGRS